MNQTNCLPAGLHVAMQPGEVALVGAGPGDPSLLTLRGWNLLQQADAIVHDRLVSPELLSLARSTAERYYTGKSANHHTLRQEDINALLVRLARQNLRVVRLKGGDPFIFGRGAEEVEHLLENGISCQIVPGVTSASACTAYSGIPLTHRELAQSCRFITGHRRENGALDLPWASFTNTNETLVFYMGLSNLEEITRELMAAGLCGTTPAALISNGTSPRHAVARASLAQLPALAQSQGFKSPTLIVIGQVVQLFAGKDIRFPAYFAAAETEQKRERVCA